MVSKETEQILLASWLQGENTEDLEVIAESDFHHYKRILGCLQRGIRNPLTICKTLGLKPLDLSEIIESYMPTLYEAAMMEISQTKAQEWMQNHPTASPETVIEAMQRFTRTSVSIPKPPENPVMTLIDDFDERSKTKMISTGITALDRMMNGIRTKELTIVGARPSVGKSAFVQQMAMQVAKQGKKVLFFPLEMSLIAVLERMLLRYTTVPQYEIRNGLKKETWESPELTEAFSRMQKLFDSGNLLIFERCTDLEAIRQLIETHKPHMVVIDQLEQLKDGDMRFDDKRTRFSHMTHELQAISLDMDVSVWLACQVNRGADSTPPSMANLKESGTIEEDATNVILLHREGEKAEHQKIVLDLAKQRNGECGAINLAFIAPKYTFYGTDII